MSTAQITVTISNSSIGYGMDSDCEDVNLSWSQDSDCSESTHCDAGIILYTDYVHGIIKK